MIQYDVECPFCGVLIAVSETTTARQREVGLVYLSTKCTSCNVRIDGAGIGERLARIFLDEAIQRRVNTRPEHWQIRPRGRTRRMGPRR